MKNKIRLLKFTEFSSDNNYNIVIDYWFINIDNSYDLRFANVLIRD